MGVAIRRGRSLSPTPENSGEARVIPEFNEGDLGRLRVTMEQMERFCFLRWAQPTRRGQRYASPLPWN